ncbi:DNA translocase FtsK [Candidatus Kaiserbacteria bacterium]|nr:DNA translocase FtsK [Candidatus Kaiserbacteria bacterium]
MSRKNGKKDGGSPFTAIPHDTRRAIIVVILVIAGLFLTLAAFDAAGIAGSDAYRLFAALLGVGYFLLPLLLFVLAGNALRAEQKGFTAVKLISSGLFFVAGLGFIQVVSGRGGLLGGAIADPAVKYLDVYASLIVLGGLSLISLLLLLEGRISLEPFVALYRGIKNLVARLRGTPAETEPKLGGFGLDNDEPSVAEAMEGQEEEDEEIPIRTPRAEPARAGMPMQTLKSLLGTYTPPPLSLLERDRGRPGVGDIKGNANIIKRTLQNFGITVELDEISIGPSVTRYAVKPAEGVRLQKILTLQKNLELALSASSVRIEAPIPGKSLVGIEVPNSSKVTVGLGAMLDTPEFTDSHKPLLIGLGRDIAGGALFANIARMPHALIAGATGSGKSVAIHTIINSLIYRCGPQQLRFIMIDPKRVELTLYRSLPHLLTPVITDAKKAIAALRWAGKEMERRYNILEEKRVRDVESYHQNILAPALERIKKKGAPEEGEPVPEAMPYIVIIIDELADIMSTYPRELEAAVVRLAQMSRAVGIHLILSTQRPSVNVITGLIKANIPARIALQVASQIDSRTILDQGGAETLLGAGDMLYLSPDMNKPVRLQNAYIGEKEVKAVVDFIAKNNEPELPVEITPPQRGEDGVGVGTATSGGFDDEEIDDDLYEAAQSAVLEAGKASTSYLQRKLRVGYARAARLIDILEERGVIGPGDGAKPRDILEKSSPVSPAPVHEENL